MSSSHLPFSDAELKELGFLKCTTTTVHGDILGIEVLQQWEHRSIFLVYEKSPLGEQMGVIDKEHPGVSLGVRTMEDLKALIRMVNTGKTISEIFWTNQKKRGILVERRQGPPENRPHLEDYRDHEIGKGLLRFSADIEKKLHLTYEEYSRAAFDYTLGDIVALEQSFDFVHTGHSVHSAIALWHMTLEAYITTLLKLCCLKKNEDFEGKYRTQDLHVRFGSLLDLLELDKRQFYQTKIVAKILEFNRFRNELMHDRHFGKQMQFDHCQFSGIPIFACQTDVLQSFLIVLETTSLLRYAIAGLDTMPTVVIQDGKRVAWEKLDVAYNELLRPFFEEALEKHAMRTRLDLGFNPKPSVTSSIFYPGEVEALLTVDQEQKFEIVLCDAKTNQLPTLIQQYFGSRNQAEDTLKIAKTTL